jgi:hypothetical protein
MYGSLDLGISWALSPPWDTGPFEERHGCVLVDLKVPDQLPKGGARHVSLGQLIDFRWLQPVLYLLRGSKIDLRRALWDTVEEATETLSLVTEVRIPA